VSLTGWQAVAIIVIAAALALAGVIFERGSPLVTLATALVTATFALLQPRRDPTTRSRASDRTPTAAGGVPVTPPPEVFPRR
jgi:hypothetical protein